MKRLLPIATAAILLLANPAHALAASLSLSPATGTFNKGCTFALDIKLDTGGLQTDGTDAEIRYDQSKVTATSISAGTIYADYPGNVIDDAVGKVTVSALASISSAFSGTGTLATVNFTIKDAAVPGATIVSFNFDASNKTNTTDSNVIQKGTITELLSSVANGNYTIGTGTTCTTAVATPQPGGFRGAPGTPSGALTSPDIPRETLPEGGTAEFTYVIAIVGSVLTVLGILGLAFL